MSSAPNHPIDPNQASQRVDAAAAAAVGTPHANPLASKAMETHRGASAAPSPVSAAPPGKTKGASVLDGVDFVMDVPVEIRVEIGRRKTRIAELLQLSSGSIVELDTPAGDPLNIYVNKRLIARGEAVMVGDRYGVRIVQLIKGDEDGRGGGK